MKLVVPFLLLGGLGAVAAWGSAPPEMPAPATRPIDFKADIAPLLAEHCIRCHGEKKQKSMYRIDSRADAIGSGSEKSAIIPGNSAESLMIILVSGIYPDYLRMPPKGNPLTAEQVGLLRAWIDQGVAWADPDTAGGIPVPRMSPEWRMAGTTPELASPDWTYSAAAGLGGEVWAGENGTKAPAGSNGVLLWNDEAAFKCGTISIRLRPEGEVQHWGGGLIWRVKDSQNYLLALYDAPQRVLGLFQVEDGVRREVARAEVPAHDGGWLNLEVAQARTRVEVRVNGALQLTSTIGGPGEPSGVGIWKPADCAARFELPKISHD